MTIASFIAVFNISKTRDKLGNEITPSDEYELGFLWYVFQCLVLVQLLSASESSSHPKRFVCKIEPRSPHHEGLIYDAMRKVLPSETC